MKDNKKAIILGLKLYWIFTLTAVAILFLINEYSFEYQASVPKENRNEPVVIQRIVTAYTASSDKTDSTPCQGALPGVNFCDPPVPIIATNELPLRTWVEIDNVEYLVADRTHSRYKERYDILVRSKEEAFNWGRRIKEITILNK